MLFLRRSNIMTMTFLFILVIFLYWLLYYSYMKYNIVWNGTILLTSITLICESRDLYQALISALRVKYNWEFLDKSIMNDD